MIYRNVDLTIEKAQRIVALGFFDGVHLGHQELLSVMRSLAKQRGLQAAVFSFSGHPDVVLGTNSTFVGYLANEAQREELLNSYGAEDVFLYPLTSYFTTMTADDFLDEWLKLRLGAKAIVVGADYRFGRGAEGNVALLMAWCACNAIELQVVPELQFGETKVSSTDIRLLVQAGRVDEARRLLGHPYAIQGVVAKGFRLGRKLGFATANIAFDSGLVRPKNGVYAAFVRVGGERFIAITNIGKNPTVPKNEFDITVEAHLFGEVGEIYNQSITVELLWFVRAEQKFATIDDLRSQIEQDIEIVKNYHANAELPYCCYNVDGVSLWLCPTTRFLQGAIRIQSQCMITPQTVAMSSLLSRILETSTQMLPTLAKVTEYLENLYGASLSSSVQKLRDVLSISVMVDGLQKIVGESSDRMTQQLIQIAEEAMFMPLCDTNGMLSSVNFALEQANLESEIAARVNDKVGDSWQQALELLAHGQPHALSESGELEQVQNLTVEDITKHWQDMAHSSNLVITVIGEITSQTRAYLQKMVQSIASGSQKKRLAAPSSTLFRADKCGTVEVKKKIDQAILHQAWSGLSVMTLRERATLRVFLSILGSDAHSLLFREIREARNLAYSIFAFGQIGLGLVWLTAGIDSPNADTVSDLMQAQIEAIKTKNYSQEMLQIAKKQISLELMASRDSLGGLFEGMRQTQMGAPLLALTDEFELIRQVTVEDVAKLAQSLELVLEYRMMPEVAL